MKAGSGTKPPRRGNEHTAEDLLIAGGETLIDGGTCIEGCTTCVEGEMLMFGET